MIHWFSRFATTPGSAKPLAALRIGLATVLIVQALMVVGHLDELFGREGLIQIVISESARPGIVPRLSWIIDLYDYLGLEAAWAVRSVFGIYVTCLIALLLGLLTKVVAIGTWIAHLMLLTSSWMMTYGVDEFAHIGLFYCVVFPVGHAWSLDWLANKSLGEPSSIARLGLRVMQVHLCIVYVSSGLEKATGIQWWNGEAIWRALMRPDLGQMDFSWLAQVSWVAMIACWGTLIVEIGYVVFIWPRRTRLIWLSSTLAMHLGIAVAMGLWIFAAAMIVLNIAAFGFQENSNSCQDSRFPGK